MLRVAMMILLTVQLLWGCDWSVAQQMEDSPATLALPAAPRVDENQQRAARAARKAIAAGDSEALVRLLSRGLSPDARVNGEPLLHMAAMKLAMDHQEECLRVLLDHGADVNARDAAGRTAMRRIPTDPAIFKILLAAGADPNICDYDGYTPLHMAATMGRDGGDTVIALITAGADVNARDSLRRTPLHYAVEGDALTICALLVAGADVDARDCDGRSALHLAREMRVVNLLTGAGADIDLLDNSGMSPLLSLIRTGADFETSRGSKSRWKVNSDAIQTLLAAGALWRVTDADGLTPLHWACKKSYAGAVRLLTVNYDYPVNPDNYGRTPLHYAAESGDPYIVDRLLKAGEFPNRQDNRQLTPLHLARDAAVIEKLLAAGASVEECDAEGNTPLLANCRSWNTG